MQISGSMHLYRFPLFVLSYSNLLILFYVVLYYGLDERGCGNQVGGEWGGGNIIRTYCMGENYFQ